jgi:ribonuclease HI
VAIFDVPEDTAAPQRAGSGERRSKGAAFSYLSLVNGVLERHTTWTDCERRVKGRSGAKFKKATSAADEAAILAAWNVKTGSNR